MERLLKTETGLRLDLSRRSSSRRRWSRREQAFTRVDLCIVIALVAGLLGLGVLEITGERSRTLRCANNLRNMGQAMQSYSNDRDDNLPPAAIERPGITWDTLISPYLKPDLDVAHSAYARRLMKDAVAPYFHCPSDKLAREYPRSYAMSGHDMQPYHWPPDARTASGVGLRWGENEIRRLLGPEVANRAARDAKVLPGIKRSIIQAPADTLLLTELFRADNTLGNIYSTTVTSPEMQLEGEGTNRMHQQRMNYLMVDGHVECLLPIPMGDGGARNLNRNSGIWTIRAND